MTVNAIKPTFTTREGYLSWRAEWKAAYARSTADIREARAALVSAQKSGAAKEIVAPLAKDLFQKRVIGAKMMTLLNEAKLRRDRIIGMLKGLEEQFASFPLTLSKCRNIDFHFNKGSLEFPFLPMWTLKAQGKSFYIHHIDAHCPWSTRELPEGSTRGMIRLRNADISIDKEGVATITPHQVELKAVA